MVLNVFSAVIIHRLVYFRLSKVIFKTFKLKHLRLYLPKRLVAHLCSMQGSFYLFKEVMVYSVTNTNVPAIIKIAAKMVLAVSVSFKNIADKIMTNATLNLSTGATFETSPNFSALK